MDRELEQVRSFRIEWLVCTVELSCLHCEELHEPKQQEINEDKGVLVPLNYVNSFLGSRTLFDPIDCIN